MTRSSALRFAIRAPACLRRPSPGSLQPFGQGDGSNTRAHGGLGLGLPLAQRLCRFMGGELNVESVPGRGTTAFFVLSLKRSDSISAPLRPLCGSGTVRALVADDNASSLAVLREMLEFLGFGVTTASSGDEAPGGHAPFRRSGRGSRSVRGGLDHARDGRTGMYLPRGGYDACPRHAPSAAAGRARPAGRTGNPCPGGDCRLPCQTRSAARPACALAPLLLRNGQRDASPPCVFFWWKTMK